MKVFKKIMSTTVAAVTLLTGMSFQVSATTYDVCDVNMDGVVNVRDAAALNRYLDGKEYIMNYNNYDANRSLTIDQSDLEFVMSRVLGRVHTSSYFSRINNNTVNSPIVAGFTPDYANTLSGKMEFMKYSFKTNRTSYYNLTPLNADSNINTYASTRIEEGKRYPSSGVENNGMVRIEGMGTGFIVGDHQIATCAHVVYNSESKQWRYSKSNLPKIKTYNANGTPSTTELNVSEIHIPKKYSQYDSSNGSMGAIYDYALITVTENLSDHLQFSLGTSYNLSEDDFFGVPVYLTGCPQIDPETGLPNSLNRLYTGQGSVFDRLDEYDPSTNSNHVYWLYNSLHVEGGDSGSPIFTITKNVINGQSSYVYTALAIASGKYQGNYGTLITKYQLQFYKNNSYMNY